MTDKLCCEYRNAIEIQVEIQDNGIIRDSRGLTVGHADTDWMRYKWRMLESGVCPCCGREVDGDDR